MTLRTIQSETRAMMIRIGRRGIGLQMAAITIERRFCVAAFGMADIAIQHRMGSHERESALLMHLPETRFSRPHLRGMAAAAGVTELVLMNVLMTTGTARIRLREFQRAVAGAATDGGMLTFQRECRLGMLERRVCAHGRPIIGDMADLAIELDRAVGILAGLTSKRDRANHRSEEQGNQQEADSPSRRAHPRKSLTKRSHGLIPGLWIWDISLSLSRFLNLLVTIYATSSQRTIQDRGLAVDIRRFMAGPAGDLFVGAIERILSIPIVRE